MISLAEAKTRKNWRRRIAEHLPGRLAHAAISLCVYRKHNGRWPNITASREVREKLQQRMILDHDPRLPLCADKVRVKEYVTDRLGPGWIIPTLWHGTELPPVDERDWPLPFVVKVNNGCGWNIFVHDDAARDWPVIEAKCRHWLATRFALVRGEWHYDKITPQILVEPFIAGDQMLPVDYKFWTFHGRVAFCNVITGRKADHGPGFFFTLFDRDWRRIPADMGFPSDPGDIPRPQSLDAMIQAAETLAADLPFVRVDFYEIAGSPCVGEMTFYPGAGLDPVNPPPFNDYVLSLWQKPSPASPSGLVHKHSR